MKLTAGRPQDIQPFAKQFALDVMDGHFLVASGIDPNQLFVAQLSYILQTGRNPLTQQDPAAFLVLRDWRGQVGALVILDIGQEDEAGRPQHEIYLATILSAKRGRGFGSAMIAELLVVQGQTHLVARTLPPSAVMRSILLNSGFRESAEDEVIVLRRPPL